MSQRPAILIPAEYSYIRCRRCGFHYRLRSVPIDYHLVRFSHITDNYHETEYDTDASRQRRIDGTYERSLEYVRRKGPEYDPKNRPLIIPARAAIREARRKRRR